jgi:hypothetical protein
MKRIKKNPLTTFLAAIITAGCFALVFMDKATFPQVSGYLTIACGLLFSDDQKFKDNFFSKNDSTGT